MKERLLFAYFPVKPETPLLPSLPTHLTVLRWFRIDSEALPELVSEVREISSKLKPIEVVIGEEAMFGEHNDVPALIVRHGILLPELHTNLLDTMQEMGAEIDEYSMRYSGPNYHPHISRKHDLSLQTGDCLTIREISLVRAVSEEPKTREIVEHFHW